MKEKVLSTRQLFDALTLAAEKHRHQRRSGYESLPYINHLIKVTDALIRIGRETQPDLLLASILHDIIEDTNVTEADLAKHFNPKVAAIVAELTDDMSLPYKSRKRLQIENASGLSLEARKIRIADKASNIEDILQYPVNWPLEKKQYYVSNAVEIVEIIRGGNPRIDQWFDLVVEKAGKILNLNPAP